MLRLIPQGPMHCPKLRMLDFNPASFNTLFRAGKGARKMGETCFPPILGLSIGGLGKASSPSFQKKEAHANQTTADSEAAPNTTLHGLLRMTV